ncbi:hypothetical protein BD324DRAFT_622925 [Kockovaella imperatae]|uniref:Uncharacterized protein n=1 Tax=Kockovaella imperatae TaxID=4999 RepID=A0A1Y1UI29_9TREE|nr:hypothetical protein BD324DRAFT_622925 [Kockovaella imperatae]ORX37698.1 hypothetical protein BD324DRAFT_622925 [Kockovaella imperatae]
MTLLHTLWSLRRPSGLWRMNDEASSLPTALLRDAASIAGVYLASRHWLKQYIPVQTHLPVLIEDFEDESDTRNSDSGRLSWRLIIKSFTRTYSPLHILGLLNLVSLVSIASMWLPHALAIFTLSYVLLPLILAFSLHEVMMIVFPPDKAIGIRSLPAKTTIDHILLSSRRFQLTADVLRYALCCSATVALVWLPGMQEQSNIVVPLVTMAYTVAILGRFHTLARVRLGEIMAWVLASFATSAGLFGLTVIIGKLVPSLSAANDPIKRPERRYFDPWITTLAAPLQQAVVAVVPGCIIILTSRYEYSKRHVEAMLRRHRAPVRVPTKLKAFGGPMLWSGLLTLALSMLGLHVLAATNDAYSMRPLDFLEIFITMPTTCLALATVSYCTGQLRSWLQYEEIWVPNRDDIKEWHRVAPLEDGKGQSPLDGEGRMLQGIERCSNPQQPRIIDLRQGPA